MELVQVDRGQVEGLREERRRESSLTVVPGFYSRLAEEAVAHLVRETGREEGPPEDVGYVLSVERPHGGHTHVTLVELYLTAAHRTRLEDVLDLVREHLKPTAYLVRTDDCRLNATLLARGHQVEAAALVMLTEEGDGRPAEDEAAPAPADATVAAFGLEHLAGLRELLDGAAGVQKPVDGAHHQEGGDQTSIVDQLDALARQGHSWVLLLGGRPLAVVARLDGGDGKHELLDLVVARADEDVLAWAVERCTDELRREGRRPAAVIDAAEPARRRTFRKAGYYSAAAYMVFYDPEAGRPSVGTITVQDLRDLMGGQEHFRLVDVLGEKHWRAGHLPGSEWMDFRGLAREARRRFAVDEPIILYCDGFT
jgi:hypothetical protein